MKKTILFFHPSSELYGSDKILIYIMKNFPEYQKILVLPTDGPLIELVERELSDVTIHVISSLPIISKKNFKPSKILPFFNSLLKFRSKIKSLTKEKPEIIYLNTLAVLPILFFYPSRITKIIHIHEILKNNKPLHKLINTIALTRADLLVCVSKAVKRNMEAALPKMKHKLHLVQNGIDFKFDESSVNQEYSIKVDKNKLNFALIGRIKPSHKGHHLLLEAISLLKVDYLEKIHFYFVGSPVIGQEYMQDELIEKITHLGLSNLITIIPFVKQIDQIYKMVDVVIVPSVFDDPFPTTVLESMYFSKPVIGTNVGGISEMLEDQITGFLVEKDNSTDLSSKISYYIENPEKIKQMGANGSKRFVQKFSEMSFNERYQKMLTDAL